MPQFTQWNVPDPTPNVMYNQAAIDQAANTTIEGRQKIGATDMEMVGRAAGSLLGMSEEDAAAAYPGMVANLQRNGFAMKAPPTYPGHAAVQNIVNSAIPIQKQYEYGILTAPGVTDALKAATGPLTFGNTGGGGGGGTVGPLPDAAPDQSRDAAGQASYNFWVGKGLAPHMAAGMAAQEVAESGGRANIWGDNGEAYGAYQHHADRRALILAKTGIDITKADINGQREAAYWELMNSEHGARQQLFASKDPDQAGRAATEFERPDPNRRTIIDAERGRDARRIFQLANPNGAAGLATVSVNPNAGPRAGLAPQSPPFNPYAGPRVAGAPPAGAPGAAPVVAPAAPPQPGFGALTPVPGAPTVTGQADVPAPVTPSPVALRTGGTDVAGPGAGPDTTLPPVAQPNQLYQTGLPGVTISGPASNALAPPAAAAPAAPVAQAPAAVPAPPAARPATGQNSPQFQAAMELNRRAQALDLVVDPTGRTKALAASLRAQAALYMQADSVSYDPNTGIGTKAITGERVADPTEDLRLRRAKDAREEAEAKRAGLPPGYRVDDQGRAYRIDGLPPDPAVAEAAKADYDKRQREQPFQGTGTNEQNRNILIAGTKSGQFDTPEYASAYADLAAPRYNMDGSFVKPNMAAYAKPTFKPPGATEVPDYASQETPVPTILNADQGKVAAYADRIREALPTISDTSDAAMNRWQVLLGKAPVVGNSLTSPEFQMHQQAERNFINAVLRRESGAAINPDEFVQARQQYIPQPGDSPQVLAQKAANRANVLAGMTREAGPGYKPAAGAAPSMPVVKSVEDYTKIPSGAVYTDPAGHIRKKP